jgi:hypothetical protein
VALGEVKRQKRQHAYLQQPAWFYAGHEERLLMQVMKNVYTPMFRGL